MTKNLKREDFVIQIRDKLRKDDIKLWLEPYYTHSSGASESDLKRLAEDYSSSLTIPLDEAYNVLLELQASSVENLKQRNRFNTSGLATLKIKILHQGSIPRVVSKEVMLTMRGIDLKEAITKDIAVPYDRYARQIRLKLIIAGKVLTDLDSLAKQGVKHGQQVLALMLGEASTAEKETAANFQEMENVKTDSKLLALDKKYMQLEDQFGKPVQIPAHEKKALIVAVALHEKGKSALKKNDYARALIFFLEADEEYKNCTSEVLTYVDNYALLDLDIAWCYLCLESVANLPEASERLKRCETMLNKTYGQNLERLFAVKGTTGVEQVLFVRLHLLQAIILYHQNKRTQALALFNKTKEELNSLKVDENSVMQLLELGYSVIEARLGLRAAHGNLTYAANYINENREKREESKRKARVEEILERERKKLGLCEDGKQYVEPALLNQMVAMGFNREVSRIALQKNNNVISDSVQYINDHPIPGPSTSRSQEMLALIDDSIPRLVEAGFETEMARRALHKHTGDIAKAADDLVANQGIIVCDTALIKVLENLEKRKLPVPPAVESIAQAVAPVAQAVAPVAQAVAPVAQAVEAPDESQTEQKDKALKRLAEDINVVDDDHLDLTLEQEESFLNRYLSLLGQ